jgi:hypothetical protein
MLPHILLYSEIGPQKKTTNLLTKTIFHINSAVEIPTIKKWIFAISFIFYNLLYIQ